MPLRSWRLHIQHNSALAKESRSSSSILRQATPHGCLPGFTLFHVMHATTRRSPRWT